MMRVAARPRKRQVERIEVGGHAVDGGHGAQGAYVIVGPSVAHDADRAPAAAPRRPARYRHRGLPADFLEVDLIREAQDVAFFLVTSPGMRIARPGPGKGCRPTKASGRPEFAAELRTSSLNRLAKRLDKLHIHARGQPAHIVM